MKMVGAVGFELTTLCSQSRCANRAALRPDNERVQFYIDYRLFVKLNFRNLCQTYYRTFTKIISIYKKCNLRRVGNLLPTRFKYIFRNPCKT